MSVTLEAAIHQEPYQITMSAADRKLALGQIKGRVVILNDTSIRERKLVRNASEGRYRSGSYDLTVGAIITADGDQVEQYQLGPQEVVKVVSAETMDIPCDVTAYVHVKTGLCNEGILSLNIGIVDPGFTGPLQSALMNFGKVTHRIKKGSVFGRITFHEQMAPKHVEKVVRSMEQVMDDAKLHVDKYLAKDFLNFSKTVKKAAKKATATYRNTLFIFLPAFVIGLAILTYFLNFSNMTRLEGYINVQDRAAEIRYRDEMAAKIDELLSARSQLQQEITDLKQQRTPQETAIRSPIPIDQKLVPKDRR